MGNPDNLVHYKAWKIILSLENCSTAYQHGASRTRIRCSEKKVNEAVITQHAMKPDLRTVGAPGRIVFLEVVVHKDLVSWLLRTTTQAAW